MSSVAGVAYTNHGRQPPTDEMGFYTYNLNKVSSFLEYKPTLVGNICLFPLDYDELTHAMYAGARSTVYWICMPKLQ